MLAVSLNSRNQGNLKAQVRLCKSAGHAVTGGIKFELACPGLRVWTPTPAGSRPRPGPPPLPVGTAPGPTVLDALFKLPLTVTGTFRFPDISSRTDGPPWPPARLAAEPGIVTVRCQPVNECQCHCVTLAVSRGRGRAGRAPGPGCQCDCVIPGAVQAGARGRASGQSELTAVGESMSANLCNR